MFHTLIHQREKSMIKHYLAAMAALCCCSSSAPALDANELKVLSDTVKEICLYPDRTGSLLEVEGQGSVGVPVLVKIVKADLSGKLSYENWKGIPITADKYKTEPRVCAMEITKILATAFGPPVPTKPVPTKPEEARASSKDLCGSMTVTNVQNQKGYDGTTYDGYYDFTRGKEQVDERACGREIWITRDKNHPLFGTKFVYLVDGQKKRISEQLYIENSDGSLRSE
jgi:hypothetical protein